MLRKLVKGRPAYAVLFTSPEGERLRAPPAADTLDGAAAKLDGYLDGGQL